MMGRRAGSPAATLAVCFLALGLAGCGGAAATVPVGDGAAHVAPVSSPVERALAEHAACHDGGTGEPLTSAEVAARIAAARVVYVGEQHGVAGIHRLQAAIAAGLLAEGHAVVVGVEMLPWTAQAEADRWSGGELGEEAFLEAVDWAHVWGHAWEAYRPVFLEAQTPGAGLLALNAPPGLSTQVFRRGLGGLTAEERALLPADMVLDGGPYREVVVGALRAHGHLPADEAERAEMEERFYAAQLVWDETMAATLAGALESLPGDVRFVVVAGAMHVAGGGGIPDRVARRVGVDQVRLVVRVGEEPGMVAPLLVGGPDGDIDCRLLGD